MSLIYAADAAGKFLGSFSGAVLPDGTEVAPELPPGAVPVPAPPADGDARWNGAAWVADIGPALTALALANGAARRRRELARLAAIDPAAGLQALLRLRENAR